MVVCKACGSKLTPNYMEGCWTHLGNKSCEFYQMDDPGTEYARPSYKGTAQFAVEEESDGEK